jgi:hypothetical protein
MNESTAMASVKLAAQKWETEPGKMGLQPTSFTCSATPDLLRFSGHSSS